MTRHGETPDCRCSDSELESLFCELLDSACGEQRAAEIRARLEECAACQERLQSEEQIRRLVRKCCGETAPAPSHLRERITVQIRMSRTEYRF